MTKLQRRRALLPLRRPLRAVRPAVGIADRRGVLARAAMIEALRRVDHADPRQDLRDRPVAPIARAVAVAVDATSIAATGETGETDLREAIGTTDRRARR